MKRVKARKTASSRRRTKKTASPASGKQASASEVSECQALMVIDSRPIREEAKSEYDRVAKQTSRIREQIRRFEREDKPSYDTWYYERFGELVYEIERTREKCQERESLLISIQSEMAYGGYSAMEAYERVVNRQYGEKYGEDYDEEDQDEDEEEEDVDEDSEEEGDPFGKEGRGHTSDEGWRRFEDFFRDAGQGRGAGGAGEQKVAGSRGKSDRVKELYRALVRRLHPDKQRESMTAQKLERWYEVQAAYEKNDSERLEVLLTICQVEEGGAMEGTTVALLMQISDQMKSTLRELKRQLSACRKDPAWNFSKRKDVHRLEANVRYALEDELLELREKLRSLEGYLRRFGDPDRRLKRRRVGGISE